jgi:hypothetical protein
MQSMNLDEFIGLPITQIETAATFNYDLYIRLATDKFVRIHAGKSGGKVPHLDQYLSKNVSILYICRSDFASYLGLKSDKLAYLDPRHEAKFQEILKQTLDFTDKLDSSGMDEESFATAKTIVTSLVEVFGTNEPLFELLNSISISHHSKHTNPLIVSLFCVMICRVHPWPVCENAYRVGMAGLLCGAGKNKILDDGVKNQSPVQRAEASADFLEKSKCVPDDIVNIVRHHQDEVSPAPRIGRFVRANPLAQIVRIAASLAANMGADGRTTGPSQAVMSMIASGSPGQDPYLIGLLNKLPLDGIQDLAV